MDYTTGTLFADEEKQEARREDDFARSCRPLAEMLDSVRHVEGFPLGRDEDILALSDPPYYTACPNPYIGEFIKRYGKPYDEATDTYERTPYVGDVSEGKNDPVYNAHSYHTKVPYRAIMKYIEHYTEEGDIVFDGFCGSGMTGVAAQLLNRRAILCDLSPAATFIAYNYNTPVDVALFEREAKRILAEVEKECGWMYETIHTDGKTRGKINYTVWSDVFICPYCGGEYVFWEAAVDKEKGKVNDEYPCPSCGALVNKRDCRRATVTFYDQAIGEEITQAKQVPVLINYTVGNKRQEKSRTSLTWI
ncbi:MAG: DNA methyltransferase [Peptococcaceae bacterium MAG4]|nr:DNA methyltransferase [Peptococcaceae bacterium MAG4]